MMRPILRKILPYEAIFSPAYDLADFALANDALDVADENDRRLAAAAKE